MSNKQVLVYGVLDSTNYLRSVFVGHIHFKKLIKFQKFTEIFYCCMTRLRSTNLGVYTRTIARNKNMGLSLFKETFKISKFQWNISLFLIQCQQTRTILRKKNMGQCLFKKYSKFQNYDEIFYCGKTRLRNTNLDVFIQCQYTRTILRKKNMGQSLIRKHSKFLNFDEIFYFDMTRHRNSILNYCGLCRYVKAIKPKKVVRQNLFKNHLRFQNFNIQ